MEYKIIVRVHLVKGAVLYLVHFIMSICLGNRLISVVYFYKGSVNRYARCSKQFYVNKVKFLSNF